jgi:NADH-quinone oxidoreductase subunit N
MSSLILKSFLPEIFLSIAILFQLLFNSFLVNNYRYNYPLIDKEVLRQTSFILFCLLSLLLNLDLQGHFFNFLFVNDEATKIAKCLLVVVYLLTIGLITNSFTTQKINFFEFFSILLLSLLSLLLLISAHDLIVFYLTIEMQSLCFYVLASLKRNSAFSAEAGLKYFISGSFISGIFLFGASLIYGSLGTLNLNQISFLLSYPFSESNEHLAAVIIIGIVCITSTLLFKIACAPFHFWAPDVYDGSPFSSTIVFSIFPKIPLFFFFIKWISSLGVFFSYIQPVLISIGLFSALLGTFFAISQHRLKRLMIYSSISQMGFLVCGISLNTIESFTSVYFFLLIYILTSILIWGYLAVFYRFKASGNILKKKAMSPLFLSSLINLSHSSSWWAFSLGIAFFSIAGIPPLPGFFAKVLIVSELINANFFPVSILLVLISSVSVFYYIRIVKTIYFEPKALKSDKDDFQVIYDFYGFEFICLIFSFLILFLVFLSFNPTAIWLLCEYLVLSTTGV